ncbi:MAG: DUF1611 domain-containing protein [Planctomycetaceae bacterium]|nr:DUF1611 domain-containing protein [Planctomycetaceae bacterium]
MVLYAGVPSLRTRDHNLLSQNFAYDALSQHRGIILLTDGYSTPFLAKTAINLLRYRGQDVVAVLDYEAAGKSARDVLGTGGDVPVVATLADVPMADALYVGIAPPGGKLPASWQPIILQAIERGLDVVSGLHDFLESNPVYVEAAKRHQVRLIDVRKNSYRDIASGHGLSASCIRIHTVGHDCSLGKMVTSVEVQQGLVQAGYRANFLATGQTGIMISGRGVPVDCVIADFVNGAIERLVVADQDADFQLIEGQGSITHPAYSAVTLGLLHGCAPDGLIYCYEAGRTHVKGLDNIPLPPFEAQIEILLKIANLRHPCRLIGIAVNSRTLDQQSAAKEVQQAEQRFGLPACDVYRDGPKKLVEASIRLRNELLPLRSTQ